MKKQVALILLSTILCITSATALCTFDGVFGDGTSWSDPDNWSCGHVPLITDPVIIDGKAVILDISTGAKTVELTGGGSITAPGAEILTITDGLSWKAGTIDASLVLKGPGGGSMVTGGIKVLKKAILIEPGAAVTWDAGTFFIDAGGVLSNDGEFAATFDGEIDFGTATPGKIVNTGIFYKTAGAGTLDVLTGFENTGGAIVADAGKVKLWEGLPGNTGDLSIDPGAALEIVDESTHAAGVMLFGTGTLELTGTMAHDLDFAYTGGMSFVFDAATVLLDAAISSTGSVTLKSGFVGGTGSLTASGTMTWEEGTLDLDTTIPGLGSLTMITAGMKVLKETLTLTGTASWSDGDIDLNDGGILDITATGSFVAGNNDEISFSMVPVGSITVAGKFEKSGAATRTTIGVPYTNTGTTDIKAGQLLFKRLTSFTSGTLNVDAGAEAEFDDVTGADVEAAASITGTGTIEVLGFTLSIKTLTVSAVTWKVAGGELDIDSAMSPASFTTDVSSGILNFNAAAEPTTLSATVSGGTVNIIAAIDPSTFSLTQTGGTVNVNIVLEPATMSVDLSGGTLDGSGTLKINSTFSWSGGTIDLTITVAASSTFTLSDGTTKTLSGSLTQNGSATWSAGNISISASGTWTNNGVFSAGSTGDMTGTGTFTCGGTFRKTTVGTLDIDVAFVLTGILSGSGIFDFAGSFTNTGTAAPGLSPGIMTKTGNFTNGAMLDIEIKDGTGEGTGHDQFVATGNITLTGELKVTEIGTVPNGSYTIMKCTSGDNCLSGDFTTTDLPSGYSYAKANNDTEIIVTKSALPVELVDFSARQQGKDILLNWETASEINNEYFEIQRSTDGFYFETIAEINGHGTSEQAQQYSYLDKNIFETINPSIIYYRLRQNDFDGQFEYSKIVAVELINNNSVFIANIYQPSRDQLNITLNHSGQLVLPQIFLFDLAGKLIMQKNITLENKRQLIQIKLNNIPTGIYAINLKTDKKYFSEKIFIK